MSKSTTQGYWLMKTEPEVFSIEDLRRAGTTLWEGVRNYQARNFMMNDMKVGDDVLVYHSNANPPGVAGLAKVSRLAVPDPTATQRRSPYFDPKASAEKPIWYCVEVRFAEALPRLIALEQIRQRPELKDLLLLRRGMRLSIQPVTAKEFAALLALRSP